MGAAVTFAEIYDPRTGAFTATGPMRDNRAQQTATLLPNGGVLVAGGWYHTSAELFDPRAGQFALTGSMTTARNGHTATLLPDGLILIAGGDSQVGAGIEEFASAELYDPHAGQFALTGSMTTARQSQTATLLPDGRVLVAGGSYGSAALSSAELYDTGTGTFGPTGSMSEARSGQTATLLANGYVLVAGGSDGNSHSLSSAELFDPAASKTGNQTAPPSVAPPTPPASRTPGPTPPGPHPTMVTTGLTTPGLASGWTGFSWPKTQPAGIGNVHQVLAWRGGYVATESIFGSEGLSAGLWTSPDGQTWTAVTSIDNEDVMVAVAPIGLIAIGFNDSLTQDAPQAVWASSDGVSWQNLGKPNLLGSISSIAGTDAGIVAVVNVCPNACASSSIQVEFSTDGLNWTADDVGDLTGFQVVQSNAGHFYLMGVANAVASSTGFTSLASESRGEMWLSGNGTNWTQSSGGFSLIPEHISFGRDGLVLTTMSDGTPGGYGQAYSTDGGKTWKDDPGFGPLGQAVCQGECAAGADGLIASNGSTMLAIKNGGGKAWLSYDGQTWTPIAWTGGNPANALNFVVLPRGVIFNGRYGVAQ